MCTAAEVAAISPRCAAAFPLRAYLGHPIRTPDGFTIGVIAALESESRTWNREDAENLRDIAALLESEIARTHEHLLAVARERAVADRFKKILGHADCLIWDAVVTCSTSGWAWQFTVQPSRLAQRLFGAKSAHPSNGPWDQFDLAERAQINERSRQAMLTGQPNYSHEFEVNVSGESAIWIHEDVAVRSIGANRFWLVGAATEVTHRKHREMEVARERDDAREAPRLKSQFLANMSHEIRTPMNGIVGMAGLLLESPLNDDQRRISQVIQESGESSLAIINDVLDLAKIEADKTSLEYRPLDLRKVVLSVVTLLHPQADRKGITLVCEISQRLPDALLGDANRIRQVVTNLVGNAVNYTRSGTVKLKLEVLSLGERACEFRLTVADTGPGIPPQIQKKLFQPFVQADEADVLRSGGTGLGLAISKQLIEQMGGRIEMDSEPGAGSAFWIELSLALAEANPVEPPEASPTPAFTPTAHHAATPSRDQ